MYNKTRKGKKSLFKLSFDKRNLLTLNFCSKENKEI